MTSPWSDLATWLGRSRPTPTALARALLSATASGLAALALFIGAPYLLVESASTRQVITAGTLAALLTGIELLAFARSPLRYAERLGSHALGLRAVSRWRRWLIVTIGSWPYDRWRDAADGDLLERALTDTDILQDLWLRAVTPAVSAVTALVLGDIFVLVLPAGPLHRPVAVLALLGSLAYSVAITVGFLSPVTAAEREVRLARAARTAALVDAQSVAADVALLRQSSFLQSRLDSHTKGVATAERHRDRLARVMRVCAAVVPLVGVIIVCRVANAHGAIFGRADLVVLLLSAAALETTVIVRSAVQVIAQVTAATERLDTLASHVVRGTAPWPTDQTIVGRSLTVGRSRDRVLSTVDIAVPRGRRLAITGPIGSGKSTLLRVLAGLQLSDEGTLTVGDTPLHTIDDREIRRHLGYVSADPRLTNGPAARVLRAGRSLDVDVASTMAPFGMEATETTRWEHLSRGEVLRVALARQLVSDPDILILDEPTSGLGPVEREWVLSRLRRFAGTLVCATHDPDVVATCDDVLTLSTHAGHL